MDDVAKPLAYITLTHIRLRFLLHCRLVVTLSHNSVAQQSPSDVHAAHALVNLLYDPLSLPSGYTPQVRAQK